MNRRLVYYVCVVVALAVVSVLVLIKTYSNRISYQLKVDNNYQYLSVDFGPENYLVAGTTHYQAEIYDVQNGDEEYTLNNLLPPYRSHGPSFSVDGKRIVTPDGDLIRIYDAETGDLLLTIRGESILSTYFSPDGNKVISPDSEAIRIWDSSSGLLIKRIPVADQNFAKFGPDGTLIISGGDSGIAYLWDSTTGQMLAQFIGHTAGLIDGFISPDSTQVITADSTDIRLWDPSGNLLKTMSSRRILTLHSIAVTNNWEFVAGLGGAGSLAIWSVDSGNLTDFHRTLLY